MIKRFLKHILPVRLVLKLKQYFAKINMKQINEHNKNKAIDCNCKSVSEVIYYLSSFLEILHLILNCYFKSKIILNFDKIII